MIAKPSKELPAHNNLDLPLFAHWVPSYVTPALPITMGRLGSAARSLGAATSVHGLKDALLSDSIHGRVALSLSGSEGGSGGVSWRRAGDWGRWAAWGWRFT